MSTFLVAPAAEDDVFQIWCYLLERADRTVADRVEREILDKFAELATTPGKGHRRPDLTSADVLFYTLYQFMIVHRRGEPLQILGVLHANATSGNCFRTACSPQGKKAGEPELAHLPLEDRTTYRGENF